MKRNTIHVPASRPKAPASAKSRESQSTQRGNASRGQAASNAGRTTPAGPDKPIPRTLAEQKTDFTSEGAPPPGEIASAEHGTIPPAMPNELQSPASVSDTAVGVVESKAMKQAFRDVARGLQDTDRGPEAGRTYKMLKTQSRPTARRVTGK